MTGKMELDTFKLEIARGKLQAIVKDMAAAQIKASANPGTTEAHDLSTSLYDAEGNGLAYAAYILFHVRSTQEGVKAILRDFKDDIHPGDAFLANDVYWGGGIHQGDACFFKPIFHDGKLLGFAAVACHMYDVGGMNPGSFAPTATEVYQEALNIPPVKILRNGKWDTSVWNFFLNNCRTPESNAMDLKAMLAGCYAAEQRLVELVDGYGRGEFDRLCAEMLNASEAAMRQRISQIADGVYEYTDWLEHNGHRDEVYKVHCRLTVSGDEMTFDFSESDPQTDGFINCGWCGLVGCVFSIIMQQIGPDIPFNEGYVRPIHIVCPKGRIVNAQHPAPVAAGHLEAGQRAGTCAMATINRALAASEEPLRQRVMGLWGDAWPSISGYGVNQHGKRRPFMAHDGSSQGAAATLTRDGLSIAGLACQSDNGVPDIEDTEYRYPLLYLNKSICRDSAGPGEYRGGFGFDCMWMLHNVQSEHRLRTMVGRRSIPLAGSFGGYPSTTSHSELCHDGNVLERATASGRLPAHRDEVSGSWVKNPPKFAFVPASKGALWHYNNLGGGGIGDPLRRSPDRVAEDVRDGWVSVGQARFAYGVIVDEDGNIDLEKTQTERAAQKAARFERSRKQAAFLGKSGAKLTGKYVGRNLTPDLELLERDGKIGVRCRHCGTHICDAPHNWREYVLTSEFPVGGSFMEKLGLRVSVRKDHEFVVREHFCPGCATLLDNQVTIADTPIPFDSKPAFYMETGQALKQLKPVDAGRPRERGSDGVNL